MPSYIFNNLLSQGIRSGQVPARSQEARDWYRNTAKNISRVNQKTILRNDPDRLTNRIDPGSMYMFSYDPKTKNDLPYFDRFPLVFPYADTSDGFMGINLHYLPHIMRAQLMDALYELASNSKYDESTRLRLSYGLLNSARKYRNFKPCIKKYLNSHVRSRFIYIYPSEWDMALFLPTERFAKADKAKVWKESREKARA